jgi:hypothetical protein
MARLFKRSSISNTHRLYRVTLRKHPPGYKDAISAKFHFERREDADSLIAVAKTFGLETTLIPIDWIPHLDNETITQVNRQLLERFGEDVQLQPIPTLPYTKIK